MYRYYVDLVNDLGRTRAIPVDQPDVYFAYMAAERVIKGTEWTVDAKWKSTNLPDLNCPGYPF